VSVYFSNFVTTSRITGSEHPYIYTSVSQISIDMTKRWGSPIIFQWFTKLTLHAVWKRNVSEYEAESYAPLLAKRLIG